MPVTISLRMNRRSLDACRVSARTAQASPLNLPTTNPLSNRPFALVLERFGNEWACPSRPMPVICGHQRLPESSPNRNRLRPPRLVIANVYREVRDENQKNGEAPD